MSSKTCDNCMKSERCSNFKPGKPACRTHLSLAKRKEVLGFEVGEYEAFAKEWSVVTGNLRRYSKK